MPATRRAEVSWRGDLMSGKGTIENTTSGTVKSINVSWPARNEEPNGQTSPEELLAAAHASCFCMALSAGLARGGNPPEELRVTASVVFDRGVKSSTLDVHGKVPGIDQATFQEKAEEAKNGCPISKALTGNVELSVTATLD